MSCIDFEITSIEHNPVTYAIDNELNEDEIIYMAESQEDVYQAVVWINKKAAVFYELSNEYGDTPCGEVSSELDYQVRRKFGRHHLPLDWRTVAMSDCYYDYNGKFQMMNAAAECMDADIREALHSELAPCSNQEFIEVYAERHATKYGEDFAPYFGGNF